MKKTPILLCGLILLCNLLYAQYDAQNLQSSRQSIPHEKGELIIEYTLTSSPLRSEIPVILPKGQEIKQEHKKFLQLLNQTIPIRINAYRPVYQHVIDRMINADLSEPDVYRLSKTATTPDTAFTTRDPIYYNFSRVVRIFVDTETDIPSLVREVESMKDRFAVLGYNLLNVSINPIVKLNSTTNDVLLPRQFAHQLTRITEAWEIERGERDVVIGIIDTGIDFDHEDLRDKIVAGYDFVHRTQIAEWQKLPGEDYLDEDNDPSDFNGHGTHVAGIAAAQGDNGSGISGVCQNCSIMPLRNFAAFRHEETVNGVKDTIVSIGGNVAESADAVIWATDHGADIINMSFAGNGPWPQAFRNALLYAENHQVVLIGSAANDTTSERRYPAAHEEVIAVASTSPDDKKSFFSNYGPWVDVSAPGEGILSTVPAEAGYAPEGLVHLAFGDIEIEALAMIFSGETDQNGISGPISFVGLARESDISNEMYDWNLEGKIALIKRGEITFSEKVERVQVFGAVGAVIFNNEPGEFIGTLEKELPEPIPVFSISGEDGQVILNHAKQQPDLIFNLIYSTFPGYSRLSGTSFSAPYVAGMAGLLLSHEPGMTPAQVRERIRAAVDDIDATNPQFAGQLGTGRVNLAKLFPQIFTSMEEEIGITPVLFPNPVSDQLYIKGLNPARARDIRICDLSGREIQDIHIQYDSMTLAIALDLSGTPKGWYVISGLTSKQREWSTKIYKQN